MYPASFQCKKVNSACSQLAISTSIITQNHFPSEAIIARLALCFIWINAFVLRSREAKIGSHNYAHCSSAWWKQTLFYVKHLISIFHFYWKASGRMQSRRNLWFLPIQTDATRRCNKVTKADSLQNTFMFCRILENEAGSPINRRWWRTLQNH